MKVYEHLIKPAKILSQGVNSIGVYGVESVDTRDVQNIAHAFLDLVEWLASKPT